MNNESAHKKLCEDVIDRENCDIGFADEKNKSMKSLIAWNISKLLTKTPNINLELEIKVMQERLEIGSWNIDTMISHGSEERHLACAILAWKQLVHEDTNSLYEYVVKNLNKDMVKKSETLTTENTFTVSTTDVAYEPKMLTHQKEPQFSNEVVDVNSDIRSLVGPVIKLPVETKIVMRLEHTQNPRITIKNSQKSQSSDIKKKIDAVSSDTVV